MDGSMIRKGHLHVFSNKESALIDGVLAEHKHAQVGAYLIGTLSSTLRSVIVPPAVTTTGRLSLLG
jgi:hypothetical protein